MLLNIICLCIGALGILGFVFSLIITKKKKLAKTATTAVASSPASYLPQDKTLFNEFISEYDAKKDFSFSTVSYRLGAQNTCAFGLSEGYEIKNGKFDWNTVRIHTGVDRAGGGTIKQLKDVVVSPFNFDKSEIIDYGNTSYGTLTILYNTKYNFCLRIGHMHPQKNIIPWSLEQLKKHAAFQKGWLLGTAGNYGASDGAHTHTEVLSLSEASSTLEQILFERYGKDYLSEYSAQEIIAYYSTRSAFKGKPTSDMLMHWNKLKSDKNIYFMNKYLYRRILDNGKKVTYYNSWLLFNL